MNVTAIYRHPVKGLRPELLKRADFFPGRGLHGDRAFAFQFIDETVPSELLAVDEDKAPWMSKNHLVMQHDWPELARIIPTWSGDSKMLRLSVDGETSHFVEASVESAEGRNKLANFMYQFLLKATPYEKARHPKVSPVRLIGSAELSSRYTDSETGPVSMATDKTFTDLSAKLGADIDSRRFRLNLILSGTEAWSELKWTDKSLQIGKCVLKIHKPLGRCANIDVHPDSGTRDIAIFSRLKPTFGHALTGVRANVIQAGEIKVGDTWNFLES